MSNETLFKLNLIKNGLLSMIKNGLFSIHSVKNMLLNNYEQYNDIPSHRKYIKLLKSYLSFVHHKW